ncbi:MAG: signal peptidase II [Actinomycetota bacterium]|nr:signal peptidase II [Actinomycetota bacterium]
MSHLDPHPGPPLARPGRRLALVIAVAAAAYALDLASKVAVVAELEPDRPRRLLGGAVYLLLTRNSGAAFSLGAGATVLLTAVAVAVVVVIVRVATRLRSLGWAVALGLVLGGALGNLTDRFARAPGFGRGHVIDFISVFADDGHVWPIFNFADSAIVCGGVLAALLALRGIEFDGRRTAPRRAARD